jgi:hypothetical protein
MLQEVFLLQVFLHPPLFLVRELWALVPELELPAFLALVPE